MARLLSMNNQPIAINLTLIAGSPYPFKVAGLGPDKRHVVMVSSTPLVTVAIVNANDRNSEQTLRLDLAGNIAAPTQAMLTAYLASKPTQKDGTTGSIALTIEPQVDLPAQDSDVGMVTRMLLAEAITPGRPNLWLRNRRKRCNGCAT